MKYICILLLSFFSLTVLAQDTDEGEKPDQDAASKALDATATQWSFQLAYQSMPDYYSDMVNVDGTEAPRPAGLDNYVQLRIVAPIPLKTLTILPRVTLRQ